MIGSSSSTSPFPAPSPHHQFTTDHVDGIRRGSLRDITTVAFGNPNALPGPAPSHFFPSVPKAKRDQKRAARLGSPPPPVPPLPDAHSAILNSSTTDGANYPREAAEVGSPSSTSTSNEEDQELEQRQRAAKYALASHGPFPSTSLSSSQFLNRSNPASLREGSSTSATPTIKSVGGGGSHGTKRRHRETADRTNWDAASELVRIEREREKVIDIWGQDIVTGGTKEYSGNSDRRGEISHNARSAETEEGRNRTSQIESVTNSQPASPADVAMDEGDGEGEDGEEEDEFDDDDGASIATYKTGASTKSKGKARAGSGEKEPAKKRSRTLTTPAQTAVLNALLAKTRFPSTETREEVGAQIGMSARRVQIWFQNRRQSQKRLRDREAQDANMSSMPTNASNHSLPLGHGIPVHPHYPYGPPTSDPYAAHRYPIPGQVPPHLQQQQQPQQRFSSASNPGPFPTSAGPTSSQLSVHQMQSRPDLSRQTSIDSLASRTSFVSAASGVNPNYSIGGGGNRREETHVSPYSSASHYRSPFPSNQTAPPPVHQSHSSASATPQTHKSSTFPSKLYFPHVSRDQHSGAPSTRVRTESTTSSVGDVKLPSLSALLNGPSGPPSRQQASQSFNYPPSTSQPAASSTSGAPVFNRAIFSPPPSSSFERLRISGPQSPPLQSEQIPTTSTSPFAYHPPPLEPPSSQLPNQPMSPLRETSPDVLDAAMEAMAYRPAGRSLPPRSTLPPLRSVFGESTFPSKPRGGASSEADKALMTPISASTSSSTPSSPFRSSFPSQAGPPRLPPISSFPINLASPAEPLSPTSHSGPTPFNSSSMTRFSNVSGPQNRSSMSSFEQSHPAASASSSTAGWLGFSNRVASSTGSTATKSNGSGSHDSPKYRSSVGSSSRTSLSSEWPEK
ncbi:uncharacterized protein JCM6883_006764 [Sporobolomyces salmoneus]|uniref:uncharacterized protein n=1 Tax=Sporobolomyces salmoneus TaxID=183962 RepID=UPI0031741602